MLVGTMHSICKVRGSNPDHHKKKKKKNLKYLVILKHGTSYAMMVKCISISFALFKKIHHSLCPKNNNYSLLRSAIGNGITKRGVEETSLHAG